MGQDSAAGVSAGNDSPPMSPDSSGPRHPFVLSTQTFAGPPGAINNRIFKSAYHGITAAKTPNNNKQQTGILLSSPNGSYHESQGGQQTERHILTQRHSTSTAAEQSRKFICVPHSKNHLLHCWSYFIIMFALYDATTVPYRWAFWIQPHIDVTNSVIAFIVLDAISDILFISNIIITLHTALIDNNAYITDLQIIRYHYLHTVWFIIDILSVTPLDLIQLGSMSIQPWTRALKIFRLIQVIHVIQTMEENRTVTLVFRLIKLLFYTVLLSHYAACIKYHTLLGTSTDPEYAVITDPTRTDFSHYLQTFYWALGSITGRDDTSPPQSFADTAFTVCMMVVGVLWFAYIVASLEQFSSHVSNANSRLQSKLKYVLDFMHAYRLPHDLQAKVKSYYSYLFASTLKYENETLLGKLPAALQTDLRLAFAATVIDKADLFEGAEAGFLAYIISFLKVTVTIPHEIICNLHQSADRMFFVQDGEVEILIGPKLAQIATLRAGDYFGEYGMLPENNYTRTSTARSVTYCTLFSLHYTDFERAMNLFPHSQNVILTRIIEHRKRTTQQEHNLTGLDNSGLKTKQNQKLKKLIQVHPSDEDTLANKNVPLTINPNGRFYRIWSITVACVTLYNALVLPFRIGFLSSSIVIPILVCDYVGDVIFWCDIVLQFRLRYLDKGTEVKDIELIKKKYLSSWFVGHVIASFPLDFFMLYLDRMQPILRVNRWVRMLDVHLSLLSKMRDSNHWELLSLSYLLFVFLMLSHFASCLYFSYTAFEGFAASFADWLPPQSLDNANIMYQYFYSQYYAMTLLAGIGRHIYPPSDYDVVLTCSLMLIGVFVVSYLIGKVGHLIFDLDAAAAHYKDEYNYAQAMLDDQHVVAQIHTRVNEYLKHIWSSQHGIDPNHAMQFLPSQLKTDIMMFICEDMIRSVPRFKNLDDNFIRALVSELKFVELPPGEWIFRQGQLGDSMYFISTGLADIIYESRVVVDGGMSSSNLLNGNNSSSTQNLHSAGNDPSYRLSIDRFGTNHSYKLKVIGAGSFFGEGALLSYEAGGSSALTPTRSASVRAQTKCQLLSLSKDAFDKIMLAHPRFARKIRALNEDRKNKLMALVTQKNTNSNHPEGWKKRTQTFLQDADSQSAISRSPTLTNNTVVRMQDNVRGSVATVLENSKEQSSVDYQKQEEGDDNEEGEEDVYSLEQPARPPRGSMRGSVFTNNLIRSKKIEQHKLSVSFNPSRSSNGTNTVSFSHTPPVAATAAPVPPLPGQLDHTVSLLPSVAPLSPSSKSSSPHSRNTNTQLSIRFGTNNSSYPVTNTATVSAVSSHHRVESSSKSSSLITPYAAKRGSSIVIASMTGHKLMDKMSEEQDEEKDDDDEEQETNRDNQQQQHEQQGGGEEKDNREQQQHAHTTHIDHSPTKTSETATTIVDSLDANATTVLPASPVASAPSPSSTKSVPRLPTSSLITATPLASPLSHRQDRSNHKETTTGSPSPSQRAAGSVPLNSPVSYLSSSRKQEEDIAMVSAITQPLMVKLSEPPVFPPASPRSPVPISSPPVNHSQHRRQTSLANAGKQIMSKPMTPRSSATTSTVAVAGISGSSSSGNKINQSPNPPGTRTQGTRVVIKTTKR